jgi:preprotein translocase subunit SecD
MDFIDERTVGPSLGAENADYGLTAVTFSFGFALIFSSSSTTACRRDHLRRAAAQLLMVIAVMSLFGATRACRAWRVSR